jgi:hypothetical protein
MDNEESAHVPLMQGLHLRGLGQLPWVWQTATREIIIKRNASGLHALLIRCLNFWTVSHNALHIAEAIGLFDPGIK